MHGLLHDIGIAIIGATVLGLAAQFLRQPIILGYLIAGALVGPVGFGLVERHDHIEVISEIGLVLLLFVIGLEMNPKEILRAGRQLVVTGIGQAPLSVALGLGLFPLLGYSLAGDDRTALYLALCCAISSTAIVVKLLYDKFELDTLPGRVTLGVLIFQDLYAILILAFQPNFSDPNVLPVLKALGSTVALLAGCFLLSRYALSRVFSFVAKTPEMVVAVSLGWCAAVSAAAGWMGLSKEMGALIAGVAISAFPYSMHVTAKTLPLRDFFLTLFFMSLGMKIALPTVDIVGPVALLVGFVIVSRFLAVYLLAAAAGAGRRTAFISTLNLCQISEFSLVIAALGVGYGHIGRDTVNQILYAMAIMAVMSSYAIRYSHRLFGLYDRLLGRLGLPDRKAEALGRGTADEHPVAILGFHRGARSLVGALERRDPALLRKLLVIDFNPEVLAELEAKGIAAHFGDISSLDTLSHAHIEKARVVLCTIPDTLLKGTDNLTLVRVCRTAAPRAHIVATADVPEHEGRLREAGASEVLLPYQLVGEHLASSVAGRIDE